MSSLDRDRGPLAGRLGLAFTTLLLTPALAPLAGCLAADDRPDDLAADVAALAGDPGDPGEDGLAEAFAVFERRFVQEGRDRRFTLGFGFHPGLSATRVADGDVTINGSATLDFETGQVQAFLRGVPAGDEYALWLVKNVEGDGQTVRPELGDEFLPVGDFKVLSGTTRMVDVVLDLGVTGVAFDLDLVVVTRGGAHPADEVVAAGARTLFEKRFFRARAGLAADPVVGPRATDVETTDALVQRGAELFFRETFGGNGRTCGTCHPLENNLTIDAPFIASRPASDPLFVAEQDPGLGELEDPQRMRIFGLIRENVDGFEAPATKFVLRSVPHTLAMSTSLGAGDLAVFPPDGPPPDQRTGWSGDGAPGRGTLNEFGFGAIMQHYTQSLDRVAGDDFRVPTQGELDALEAFQLFSGRQRNPNTQAMTFASPAVERGKSLFVNEGLCVACHRDLVGGDNGFMVNTGIETISTNIGLPIDGGFGTAGSQAAGFGTGRFNVPPLVEAADTEPLFHNGSVATIEDAISFYQSTIFAASPGRSFSGTPSLDDAQAADLAAFLRVVNALENIRQVRKRVTFVQTHRGPGNTAIIDVALADTQDAIDVLAARNLSTGAVHALQTIKQTLVIARANPDDARPAFLGGALIWLGIAKGALVTFNPNQEF